MHFALRSFQGMAAGTRSWGRILCHVSIGLMLFVSSTVSAQDNALPAQNFAAPTGDGGSNYITTIGTEVLGHLEPSVGLALIYARDPLVLHSSLTDESVAIIQNQVQGDLLLALGLFENFEIGAALPATLYQDSGESSSLPTQQLDTAALGDLRVYPKWELNRKAKLRFAVVPVVTLPTGNADSLQGNASATVEPRVATEFFFDRDHRLGANLGYIIREQQSFENIDVGNELTWSLGYQLPLKEDTWVLLGELYGKVAADGDSTLNTEEAPLELIVATRYWLTDNMALTGGFGPGLGSGYGAPLFRAFTSLVYTVRSVPDRDNDGISDDADLCPTDPEDIDDYEDSDGCPDLDNDDDKVLDVNDGCINVAEDIDAFEDGDGCPDPDNDKDGILDLEDQCPNKAEDKDDFQDEDGCPDPDNDNDGILDDKDQCPNEPEVINNIKDEDGCPDEAKVTLTDTSIDINERIFFEFDRDVIKPESHAILRQVASLLKANPNVAQIEIQGHTDDTGNAEYNMDLSKRRAKAVRQFLIDEGIASERLTSQGYGKTKPLDTSNSKEAHAKNRRVEFVIIKREAQ